MAKQHGISGIVSAIVITLWVGALWMTAITASVLFKTLPDRTVAGQVAGQLFSIVSYIGMGSAVWLLLSSLLSHGLSAFKSSLFWVVLLMGILVCIGEFGIQPLLAQLKASALPKDVMQSVFAKRFSHWHGIASIAYLLECLLGIWLVIKSRG